MNIFFFSVCAEWIWILPAEFWYFFFSFFVTLPLLLLFWLLLVGWLVVAWCHPKNFIFLFFVFIIFVKYDEKLMKQHSEKKNKLAKSKQTNKQTNCQTTGKKVSIDRWVLFFPLVWCLVMIKKTKLFFCFEFYDDDDDGNLHNGKYMGNTFRCLSEIYFHNEYFFFVSNFSNWLNFWTKLHRYWNDNSPDS